MKPKIYIDGQEGTTGLQIHDRLGERDDIELLLIDPALRKDIAERKKLLNSADIVILCLPDDAAREAVAMIENDSVRVIDASTAYRTAPGWVYGYPEMSKSQREKIKTAKRLANPGCHAVGFISLVYPLVSLGILPKNYPLTCFSLTGYSGGGKKMIAQYEQEKTPDLLAPRLYGLTLRHKHFAEMTEVTGLTRAPVFCPVVDDYYKGMATTVMLHDDMLCGKQTSRTIRDELAGYYAGQRFVKVAPELGSGYLNSNWGAGTNDLMITVSGTDGETLLTARFDNLGKGASGAAVQNLNIMLGLPEETGLI
ncbi:N-acetyl-gamma-glutamyl-phosphate reductase [Sporobacter termitidis DSM 10068]|uniref:N-acetyl-gamma-glutamyl-phosphate reductase n=1 Tax=Sporobacter termitidis DSM 10068 TaxID=1123282 RepID=A0A1M5Y1G5_9FIRM|nr:N-acetyl-gamma-glutamyl-phosphate reductase [Sporobacter termitidis]SHI05915.1 N-acetyl-gamma-glutamyl-phosphate reductase [Sporobacter termitidis DSM 10068]